MVKKILIIICSTLLVITGIFFGIRWYTKYAIGYTKAYVATHQISQRSLITIDDLQEVEVPKDYLKDDVYLNKEDIIGKYVKLSYSIPKGSLIYKTAIEEDISDLANTLLKEGEVNYDIYTSDVKINTANIAKNMYVDMYLTIDTRDKPISDLLIFNARVTGLYDSNNKPILEYDKESRVQIVSFAIRKEDVNVLNKAQVIGKINCVVNNNAYDMRLVSSLNNKSSLFEYFE